MPCAGGDYKTQSCFDDLFVLTYIQRFPTQYIPLLLYWAFKPLIYRSTKASQWQYVAICGTTRPQLDHYQTTTRPQLQKHLKQSVAHTGDSRKLANKCVDYVNLSILMTSDHFWGVNSDSFFHPGIAAVILRKRYGMGFCPIFVVKISTCIQTLRTRGWIKFAAETSCTSLTFDSIKILLQIWLKG